MKDTTKGACKQDCITKLACKSPFGWVTHVVGTLSSHTTWPFGWVTHVVGFGCPFLWIDSRFSTVALELSAARVQARATLLWEDVAWDPLVSEILVLFVLIKLAAVSLSNFKLGLSTSASMLRTTTRRWKGQGDTVLGLTTTTMD